MAKTRVVDIVDDIFAKRTDAEDLSIEFVDVEYVKEGPNKILRVFIDKEGGIGFEDCKSVTKFLEEKLDKIDPIKEKYLLEVSSCGIERALRKIKDFERFEEKLAEIKLYSPLESGEKSIIGILKGLTDDGKVKIENEENDELVVLEFEKIASAKLKFRF